MVSRRRSEGKMYGDPSPSRDSRTHTNIVLFAQCCYVLLVWGENQDGHWLLLVLGTSPYCRSCFTD